MRVIPDAERMASVAIAEYGDCLTDLGRLDEAAAAYEDAIQRAENLDDKRQIAVNKGQLGTVRILQQRYDEALAAHVEARETFETLGEPGSVAVAWHQIGMVHRHAGQFEQAERAYRQSLAIEVQQKDRAGEAGSLHELGNLYDRMGRLEEAVTFYRQAANIDVTLRNLIGEGRARNNLADTLIKLHRYDEARQELHRAIECDRPFGHAAEPWTTWTLLHDLEQATGNTHAAADAWQQAVQSYLAYRRDGGESQEPSARLCARIAHDYPAGRDDRGSPIPGPGCGGNRYVHPGLRPWFPSCKPSSTATAIPLSLPIHLWTTTMLRNCSCCWRRWERHKCGMEDVRSGMVGGVPAYTARATMARSPSGRTVTSGRTMAR